MSDVSMSDNNGGGAGDDLPGERLAILDAGSQVLICTCRTYTKIQKVGTFYKDVYTFTTGLFVFS